MPNVILTQNTTFIIGPVASFLGIIINAIFNFLNIFGITNIGLSIILFTVIVYMLMLPLSIRQQKFSKLQAKITPEVQAINKKYQNKKDQASVMKMNEETKAVYEKYGVSPTGSCLQMLIQMPILLSLYQVIQNIPAYIEKVKAVYYVEGNASSLVNIILGESEAVSEITEVASRVNVKIAETGITPEKIVDVLYKFGTENWEKLTEIFQGIGNSEGVAAITNVVNKMGHMNDFLGLNISVSPLNAIKEGLATGSALLVIGAALIPLLSGLTQFISTKLMPQPQSNNNGEAAGAMENSMSSMNKIFPLMSVAFCLTLPVGIGIYWIASAVIRAIQQFIINKHFDKVDIDELVKKNMDKVNRKREKKGLPPQKVTDVAKINTRNIEESKKKKTPQASKKPTVEESTAYYNSVNNAKEGSLASKAGMVQKYNEKNKK